MYGPLVNGATTVLFESVPTYPNHCRYWDLIQRHKVTQFYTAPTAIRALMRFGTEDIAAFDRSTLRVLGSVGEPINPEAWKVREPSIELSFPSHDRQTPRLASPRSVN